MMYPREGVYRCTPYKPVFPVYCSKFPTPLVVRTFNKDLIQFHEELYGITLCLSPEFREIALFCASSAAFGVIK